MKLTATLEVLLRDLPKILAAGVEVTEVEVSKKAPAVSWGGRAASWFLSCNPEDTEDIPVFLFEGSRPGYVAFDSEEEAIKALSDAAIAWAMQQNQREAKS